MSLFPDYSWNSFLLFPQNVTIQGYCDLSAGVHTDSKQTAADNLATEQSASWNVAKSSADW